jgi:hypothetical protein
MIPRQFLITTVILLIVAIAMSVYVWRLRRREILSPLPVASAKHVIPPPSGPQEKVTVWIAYDSSGTLRAQSVSIPLTSGRQQRAEELMRALLEIYTVKDSPHPLQPAAEVHNVYLVEPGVAVLDVNAGFVEGQTSGILAEELTVASLVRTLAENVPGLSRVKILVDGKEQDTLAGHAELSEFYDVSQAEELSKQLSSQ